jgi:outer membrane protein OmpA-like peptidoglycan-associated protein
MKKQCCFTWFLIMLCTYAYSQDLKDLLAKGDRLYNKKDYENALRNYLEAMNMDPDNAEINFKAGVCYLYTDKKSKAVPYLEKAYHVHPEVDDDIEYHLGLAYQSNHQYAKAKEHYQVFKQKNKKLANLADHKIHECVIGDSLSHHPVNAVIENFGPGINSPFHEYSPLISADGNTLIFTSNRSTDDYKIKSGTNFEDIYICHKNGLQWSDPEKISPNINIKFHDAAAWLSADGKTLLLYYEEGTGDIYTSKLEDAGWTQPVPLNKNINTPLFWETSASISADGKKLYFASNRPGGHGELDIWVSELDSKGDWAKPVNLGSTINTPLNEDSPFIHPDGVTLYFSSDGHPTMGSNDIFKSELVNGKWTKPANLGYPINSIEYDGFFSISDDKKTAYYSAMREDGIGNADVYTIRFLEPKKEEPVLLASTEPVIETKQEEVKPEPVKKEEDYVDPIIALHKDMKIVTVLKGKVIDEISAVPLGATISLVDNETRQVVSRIYSNPSTGDFELVIPHGGNYGVATELPGYLFNSINFNLPQFAEYQEIDTHILMVKAQVGSKAVLKNIFFDTGKSEIKSASESELEKLRELLVNNAHMKVQINGHTDNTGNAASNKILSLARAESVVRYLIGKGIDPSRLTAKGFGAERPLVSNDDEQEGREINRRTEIEIIEAGQG